MTTKKPISKAICGAILACAALIAGCSPGMKGTYSDAGGGMVLDLKSGGKATFTFQGDAADCTYDTNEKN